MILPFRYLPLIALTFGLSSCDSVKNKLVAFLDEKIEQTGGEPAAADADGSAEVSTDPASPSPSGAQSPIRKISDADFEAFTKIPGHVVVVDFYADWCGPCKRLAPILESIAHDNGGKVLLGKMDVDQNQQTPARLGVRGIPDVRIYVNGQEVDRFVGLMPEEAVREKIESHLGKISGAAPMPKPEPKPEPVLQPAPKPEPVAQPAPKPQEKPVVNPQPVPEEAKPPGEEPKIKRMDKDWLPPGVQRKGS